MELIINNIYPIYKTMNTNTNKKPVSNSNTKATHKATDKAKTLPQKYTNQEKHAMLTTPVNLWFEDARRVTENWTKETTEMKAIGFGLRKRGKIDEDGNKKEGEYKKQDIVKFVKVGTSIHIIFRKENIRLGVIAYNKKKKRYMFFLANSLQDNAISGKKWTSKHHYLFLSLRRAIIDNLISTCIKTKKPYRKKSNDKDNVVINFGGLITVFGQCAMPISDITKDELDKWSIRHKIVANTMAANAKDTFGKPMEGKSNKQLIEEKRILNAIIELTQFRQDNA